MKEHGHTLMLLVAFTVHDKAWPLLGRASTNH